MPGRPEPVTNAVEEIESDPLMRGTRSPEEEQARSRVRSIAHTLGTKVIRKNSHVEMPSCPRFPEGLMTAFNGWEDLEQRLSVLQYNPDLVIDGVYVEPTDDNF